MECVGISKEAGKPGGRRRLPLRPFFYPFIAGLRSLENRHSARRRYHFVPADDHFA